VRNRLLRALVVVLMLAACSSDRPSTATKKLEGIPTLAGATQPPGTKLGNGFTVASGAALIADVFPLGVGEALSNLPIEDRGWRALLLITGDPREVVRHYLREAERTGLALRSGDRWAGPSVSTVPRPDVYCGTDVDQGYLCAAAGTATTGSRTRSLQLVLRRQSESRGIPLSFATITYREGESQGPSTTGSASSVQFGPDPPRLPALWPSLPRPGQRVPLAFDAEGLRVRIEDHTRPVAHAVLGTDCAVGSAVVVLRIDGDPATVLSTYRRQFASLVTVDDSVGSGVQRGHVDSTVVLQVSVLSYTTYRLTAFVRKGRPTWGLLETCNE
jgi:hypothetical protein